MTGDGDLLLRFLRLTGWRVEVYEDLSAIAAFAERPQRPGEPAMRVSASGSSRPLVALELFERACEQLYGRRPTIDVPPEAADISLLH